MRCGLITGERYLNATLLSNTAGFLPAIGRMYCHYFMNILEIKPFLDIYGKISVSIFLRIYYTEA
jgi:hypothetical protein